MGTAHTGSREATLDRCRDPGFTPGARDVEGLIALWERTTAEASGPRRRKQARLVVQALARGDRGVARALARGWADAGGEQRAMRLQVLARIAGRMELTELAELLPRALRDPEPRVLREAARTVGKLDLDDPEHEAQLIERMQHAKLPEQRAIAEALGRIGGPRAQACLSALATTDDDLTRRTAQALALIDRRSQRQDAGSIRLDQALPHPGPIWLRCRAGAAVVVRQQAEARLPERPDRKLTQTDAAVGLRWDGSLGSLYRVRSATEVALEFPLPRGETLAERVVAGLHQPALVDALRAWTDGPPRFRLTFTTGGRRRAVVWTIVQRLAESNSPLVNDSRGVTWTVEVDEPGQRLWCLPRGADPRFTYRERDLPAATHPTLAALLAWAGDPQPGETVWDPFCGSGSELVEAAHLCPDLHLVGTDISAAAIESARTNLAAAGLDPAHVHLQQASALETEPRPVDQPVSLILSNPPMGRRVMVEDRRARQLLHDFIAHAARVLAPGGRMVWLSPAPRATAHSGRTHGLRVDDLPAVDMSGFWATPQILRKP